MSKLTFADYFNISKDTMKKVGTINPCFAYDLPLFVDPFLIFANDKKEYEGLHKQIIDYMKFLYEESKTQKLLDGRFKHLFVFPEIKQNWFGYTEKGNGGKSGSLKMGRALNNNLNSIFQDYGLPEISNVIHLEEVSLLEKGIGKDNISDFTTRIILDFLLKYTEDFTNKYIDENSRKEFNISRAYFDYTLKTWMPKKYTLPNYNNDFVILVPDDIVVREELWLNKSDILSSYEYLPTVIANDELRDTLSNYFASKLPVMFNKKGERKEPYIKDKIVAARSALKTYPIAQKFYLKYKEENKDNILQLNKHSINDVSFIIPELASQLAELINKDLRPVKTAKTSYEEALARINYLKKVIEYQDGYKLFYNKGQVIRKEEDLQYYFKAVWFASEFDMNAEVNNGRGPVDFKVSYGANDQTIIEFKLASNGQLKNNLLKQAEVYAEANNAPNIVKVIIFFTLQEQTKLKKQLKEIGLDNKENIILIDARNDNKQSASKVKA